MQKNCSTHAELKPSCAACYQACSSSRHQLQRSWFPIRLSALLCLAQDLLRRQEHFFFKINVQSPLTILRRLDISRFNMYCRLVLSAEYSFYILHLRLFTDASVSLGPYFLFNMINPSYKHLMMMRLKNFAT